MTMTLQPGTIVTFARRKYAVVKQEGKGVTIVSPDGKEYVGVHIDDKRLKVVDHAG